jgi:hypothetical protein
MDFSFLESRILIYLTIPDPRYIVKYKNIREVKRSMNSSLLNLNRISAHS